MAHVKKRIIRRRNFILAATIVGIVVFGVVARYLYVTPIAVLQPAGPIAAGQRELMVVASVLMLLIVVPVFTLAGVFAWRYRESNKKARYAPNWDHNRAFEVIWWFVPSALIAVLAVMTWHGTYAYDPYKPLLSNQKQITIQAVALDWRWLFIYPEQKVASINYVRMPVNTPIKFEVTSDAPMNSFWIPQLGGQVYAMPGMGTQLHLMANEQGDFYGSSANISGKGFAGMNFVAAATPRYSFDAWVADAQTKSPLTLEQYAEVAAPTTDRRVYTYSAPAAGLYDTIISKYMTDHTNMEQTE